MAPPTALQQQRARALLLVQLGAVRLQAAHVTSHNGLQLQRCICCLRQPVNERASLVPTYLEQIASNATSNIDALFWIRGAHNALHGKGCTRGNDPVVNISADEVPAINAADHCGARVAVTAARARHQQVDARDEAVMQSDCVTR